MMIAEKIKHTKGFDVEDELRQNFVEGHINSLYFELEQVSMVIKVLLPNEGSFFLALLLPFSGPSICFLVWKVYRERDEIAGYIRQ
jgi:hypothetical protein